MIAELYGKINESNSNLTCRSEDELTGNFFGTLRYLPFHRCLKQILKVSVFPQDIAQILDTIQCDYWNHNITFWPREDEGEPDILLTFDHLVIIIEVKLHSGLSSDDDVANATDNAAEDREESCNQLAREARTLQHIANGREKVLLLLAPQSTANNIYTKLQNRNILGDVTFGYLTWQRVHDALNDILPESPYEKLMLDDLKELLRSKGFEGFRGFRPFDTEVKPKQLWSFDYAPGIRISFRFNHKPERGLFYEFR